MTIKRTIFWMHLIAGVVAGIVIFLLSLSGVLLTYERQIMSALENSVVTPSSGITVDADVLAEKARLLTDGAADGLVFSQNPQAPVYIQAGRSQQGLLDPYSGEFLGEGAAATKAFFKWVTGFHRWFALEGESRGVGKAITGAANLIFLFIIISGLYLWLPRVWKWRAVRMILFFRRGLPSAKARDYNWHNVIGIWSLIPLFFVVTTAAVFSYGWANNLVYAVYGEEAPARPGPPPGNNGPQNSPDSVAHDSSMSLQQLLETAQSHTTDWQRITLSLPKPGASSVDFVIDTGSGGEPHKRTTLSLDRQNGEVIVVKGFGDNSPGQQARMYIRFLHTGESLGLTGQTLAGLASLGACFLVYTGLALAYRRLLQPLWQKNR